MKLSLAIAFAAFFCSCSYPTPTHAFLLTNLASRSLKHLTPPQQKGLYSRVEYDAREPRLDEFGLPLDPSDLIEKPSVPLKDRIYGVIDKTAELVEGFRGGGREENARRIVHQRRSTAKALAVKDKVLVSLDYVTHPGKAWKAFIADPISARQQRKNAIQAEKRAKLEKNLQRYYAAKNRFYETLDVIESTSRTTVKVAKAVGSAVVGAPATVKRTVKKVQDTTDAVAKVALSVSSVVSKISSVIKKEDPSAVDATTGAEAGKGKKDGKKDGKEGGMEAEADPVKVREIWETKEQTAVRTIWEEDELATKPPASVDAAATAAPDVAAAPAAVATTTDAAPAAVAAAPSTPVTTATPAGARLSFRQRLDAEEGRRSAGGARAKSSSSSMGKGLSFRQRLDAEEKTRSRR